MGLSSWMIDHFSPNTPLGFYGATLRGSMVLHYVLSRFHCKCNNILFNKLPWPGDSEGTFRSSSQAATCPPVYHTRRRLHTVPLIAERQAEKL